MNQQRMTAPPRPTTAIHTRHLARRIIDRTDTLTAQRVEVGIIFQMMLGNDDAAEYMRTAGIPARIVQRVLTGPAVRRGLHDACGVRVDTAPCGRSTTVPEPGQHSAALRQPARAFLALAPGSNMADLAGTTLPNTLPERQRRFF